MTRVEYNQHATQISGANNPAKQVSSNAYNDNAHSQAGVIGYDEPSETLLSSGVASPASTPGLVVIGAETGTADDLDTLTSTDYAVNDHIYLKATVGDTITVGHGTGNFLLKGGANKVLSETVLLHVIFDGTNFIEQIADNTSLTDKAQTFSQIQTMLGLEITGGTTLQKINKRAVFPFTGKLLDVTHYWTLSDVTGSGGTAVIQDGIDGGVRITTPASASAKTSLTQNDVRHWNPANCIFWGIGKYQNVTVSMHQGISDNNNSATDNGVWFNINTDTSFMLLLGREAGLGLAVNTDVSTNVSDPVPYKIICSATNQKLYLLVGGVWTLKATQSTKLPTAACQPHLQAITSNSDANWAEIIFMELVNLTN
jgi:hypothetical protein